MHKPPKKYAKPLSLHPLTVEQAVSGLFKVKPEPKVSRNAVQKMDKLKSDK